MKKLFSGLGKKNSATQTNAIQKPLTLSERLKNQVFGTASSLHEKVTASIATLQRKLKLKSGSGLVLFKKALHINDSNWNTSLKNIDLIENVEFSELKKKYSVKGSKEKILKNMINDYKRGRLSLSNLQNSKYDTRKLDKERLHNMLNDYEMKQREKYIDLKADELKKKFTINKSQENILNNLVDDYKKGKISATALSNVNGFDPKKINQDKLNDMLQKYENSPAYVARKFSLKESKERVLEQFMDAYRNNRISAIKFVSKTGFNLQKLNKKQLNNILNKYEAEQNKKWSKSKYGNFMEDFKSVKNQSLLDNAIKRYPVNLSKKYNKSKLLYK